MDVLADILKVVKLDAALFFNAEFSAPWCFSVRPSREIAHYLSPSSGHLIVYHFVTEGRAYAGLIDGQRVELAAGDIVILPHGDAHLMGNGRYQQPIDSLSKFAQNMAGQLQVARYGGGGEMTRFICGYMACSPRLSEVFLAGLPRIFKVNVSKTPSGEWIEESIRFSVNRAEQPDTASSSVRTKLSEVLFVETLRGYINSLPADQIGWLAGARDPVVGQALSLLHQEPEQDWTIMNLAKSVGLSRTRLAERFRHFLGESPIAYLTHWRLKLAAELLQTSDHSVAQVAATVGYGSEASFNRAFKREFACPPAQFRRQRRALA
ncbi:MAG TPA: AraC family transcriptional regulator [Pyrinomonadaceae bacterium]|nr:AraC family transcriptional regulator [Pyrinomonadaceae bacterium]